MTVPLFDAPTRPHGPLRTMLAARIERVRGDGHPIDDDLAHLALSLADRIDAANAAGAARGFVMLSAEFRATRAELFDGLDAAADDGFERALTAFRNAATSDAADAGGAD